MLAGTGVAEGDQPCVDRRLGRPQVRRLGEVRLRLEHRQPTAALLEGVDVEQVDPVGVG